MADAVPLAHAARGQSLDGGCRIGEEVAVNRRGSDGERDPAAGGTTQQRGQPLTITSRARLFDVGSCHDTLQSSLVDSPPDAGAEESACRTFVAENLSRVATRCQIATPLTRRKMAPVPVSFEN